MLKKAKKIEIQAMYGAKIREIRKRKHLTQKDVAQKAGFPRASLSLYELDLAEIPAPRLVAIARALNVDVSEITGYEKKTDFEKLEKEIKSLDIDKLEKYLIDKWLPDDATEAEKAQMDRLFRFVRHLGRAKVQPGVLEIIESILEGVKKKSEE